MPGNPNAALSTATTPQVIGALKATNSKDIDVLFAAKQDLLDQYRPLKMMSMIPIFCGVLISLTVIGAVIGVPLVILGFWLRRKCKRNMTTVESAYDQYLSSIGALPRAAPTAVAG